MASIDLARLAKAQGVKRPRIEVAKIEPSKAQQDDLARLYMRVVRIWAVGAKDQIFPAYQRALAKQRATDGITRDGVDDLEIEIATIDRDAVRSVLSIRGLFVAWAERLQLWHLRRFVSSLLYSSNVDLSTQLQPGDVQETIEDIVARNMALIRNVSDQARGRISDIVFRGLQNRTPAREMAKEIAEATGMARDRSLRIASDQTQKLSASLDRQRQLQVGMKKFEWRHSGKVHFRQEHKARNGKVFDWSSDVGRTDPPGFAPFCGCKAKGILDLD
ncbi:phage head morphogenesis protein [Phyllobacterium phragmitis]|uniref:Phage head morphogenesis protein n=1 Tax=Phyllobacterium phragmitis TaxID=2670329 RepID=A0A2S9ILG2_9HYPH|nr:phage minor head protein [Phyllobacterium phragmitis]PRD41367.1 phage head morphogenesis protein [Phyllobacterium phragmitis]